MADLFGFGSSDGCNVDLSIQNESRYDPFCNFEPLPAFPYLSSRQREQSHGTSRATAKGRSKPFPLQVVRKGKGRDDGRLT